MWQADHTATLLRARLGAEADIRKFIIKTKGDAFLDAPLSQIGGKGLFVKEIEDALLSGRADIAVHSLKDVPMELPPDLVLGAVLKREDPADMLVSVCYSGIMTLLSGANIGTSSLRRQAQILSRRPDLRITPLRGNVDTRLRKLQEGQCDAVVLAAAGMRRLNLSAPYMDRLAPERFLPAAGQGALGLEIRADRQDLIEMLAPLEDQDTRLCIEAERGFLAGLEGGGSCQAPIAAHAVRGPDGVISLDGLIARLDGSEVIRMKHTGAPQADTAAARALGLELAKNLLENGGRSVLNSILYAPESE
jgi:hydroxymethylbilane synthase